MFEGSLYDISFPCVVQEIGTRDAFDLRNERPECFLEFFLLRFAQVDRVHRDDYHGFVGFFTTTDHEMTPEAYICFYIIGRKSIFSCEIIECFKYIIDSVITKNAVGAVYDTVELARLMETESVFIVHVFTS